MTLPLSYTIADNVAWITLVLLFSYYIYLKAKRSGQYNKHCPICNLDVRKIKANNSRYLKLVAHDKFNIRNPLDFYQVNYFCGFEHLNLWLQRMGRTLDELSKYQTSKPVIELPSDEELDKLGSKS